MRENRVRTRLSDSVASVSRFPNRATTLSKTYATSRLGRVVRAFAHDGLGSWVSRVRVRCD